MGAAHSAPGLDDEQRPELLRIATPRSLSRISLSWASPGLLDGFR